MNEYYINSTFLKAFNLKKLSVEITSWIMLAVEDFSK